LGLVVFVRGDIDMERADELDQQLREAVDADPAVIVDLDEVTFLDSSGIQSLIRAQEYAAGKGRRLNARGARDWVARCRSPESMMRSPRRTTPPPPTILTWGASSVAGRDRLRSALRVDSQPTGLTKSVFHDREFM
jgi:anti-anti-sigma factor